MAYTQEKLRKISYQGKVTKVNYSLCYFEMDETVEVYAIEFAVDNNEHLLPLLNETITLKNVLLYDRSTLIVTSKSKIINSNKEHESYAAGIMLHFEEFHLAFELKPVEYKKIKTLHDKLIHLEVGIFKDNVQYAQIDVTSLLLEVLETVVENERNSLLSTKIKLPSDFKITPEINRIEMAPFSFWQAGVHKFNKNDILIGLLNVSNKFGFLMISDTTFELPIIIAQNDSKFTEKIAKLLNQFVFINNYVHITETYKKAGSINCIYADIKDIELIETPDDFMIMNKTEEVLTVEENSKSFKVIFVVINKSSITQKGGEKYFFIRVKYVISSDEVNFLRECIFKVIEELLHIYPILNENDNYCFYTDCKNFEECFTKQSSEKLFTIFQTRLKCYNMPLDIKLKLINEDDEEDEQLIIDKKDKPHIYTVREANNFLKTTKMSSNSKLITVEGIVTDRGFFSPLKAPPANKEFKLKPFGIPGNKVHNITIRNDLKTECGEKVEAYLKYINEDDECYENALQQYFEGSFPVTDEEFKTQGLEYANIFMHNFNNLQCPLGLISDMRVIFKNIIAVKGKYFKPTMFTCIDVISYEPLINYSCANAVSGSENWGPQISLGNGNSIPTNMICWGTTIQIKITQLSMKFKCSKCRLEVPKHANSCCEQNKFNFVMSLTLVVRDSSGIAKITTNKEDVLRVLLNKEKNEWSLLMKNLKIIKGFFFKDYSENEDDEMEDEFIETETEKISNAFLLVLRAWNEAKLHHIDLKCRKLKNREKSADYLPFWWCLEARRSFATELPEN